MKLPIRYVCLLICIVLVSCSAVALPLPDNGPRYVFLFIGDGMGSAHVEAAGLFAKESGLRDRALFFSDFPVVGWASTGNVFGAVTDSAAAGTAIASGHKTANGFLNVNPLKTRQYSTIAQFAKSLGRKIGVITSVSLDHATPAAFYATSSSRSDYYEIALQLVYSGFNYFAGEKFLKPLGDAANEIDIYKKATDAGYRIVTDIVEVDAIGQDSSSSIIIADSANALSLATMTKTGIRAIDNTEGFFIVVEGGKIDWESHDNQSKKMVEQVIAFDDAIGEAMAFLLEQPEETLIVVTADHETGGLSLDMDYSPGTGVLQRMHWSKTGHTGVDVPVFALGLGQDLFKGKYENTGIFERLHVLLEASEALP